MMIDTPTSTVPSEISAESRAWPMRLWLAAPDWLFRVIGLAFFTVFTWVSAEKYWSGDFWNYVPWSELPSGKVIRMPWVPVLIDLTYLLIAISFIVRFQPKSRAADGRIILITLFTAFAPFIFVMWLGWGLGLFNESWKTAYYDFLWRSPITWYTALVGGVLITVGNILDVWGYLVLCRSFGIVPEARELKTTGPYRFVRHPVYLGQFIAQAGVWLCFARLHVVWIGLYCAFVALQLYRSKLEDRVLEEAFGEEYREWKRRTFWFV
ncbi:methyltransferase family protein [Bythopirellula goksoeyrii]|nr:isoprenylcysteine carboxylmethyltransferase family protein [Bythopirellula goksoeyrii]